MFGCGADVRAYGKLTTVKTDMFWLVIMDTVSGAENIDAEVERQNGTFRHTVVITYP